MVAFIKGLFLGKLGSPEAYAAEPVEAVTLFCGRFVELTCWRDAIGYQRMALAAAARSPAMARAVYETLFAGACRSLAAYLCPQADPQPGSGRRTPPGGDDLVARVRHLYGVDEPCSDVPDDHTIGGWVDLKRIRETVKLIAPKWKI